MSFGVHRRLVDAWVQGGDIDVVDLLARRDLMVQFDGIGTSSTESVTRLEGVDEVQVVDEGLDLWIGFFETFPFAPPDLNDIVPLFGIGKLLDFVLSGFVDIMHSPIIVTGMFFVAVWITGRASVGETSLKFVDGVGVGAITIHMDLGPGDLILAFISDMLYVLAMRVRIGAGQQIVGVEILEGALA